MISERLSASPGANKYSGANCDAHLIYLHQPMDLAGFRETFVDLEYKWSPSDNFYPKIIVDLGAHIGDTALYYHYHYPEAQIIAVEPSPENFKRLVENTKNTPLIYPVQAAIGPENKLIKLNLLDSSLGHSVIQRKESSKSVEVEQIDIQTLFSRYKIQKADLIKFDIEGAEFALFESIGQIDSIADNYIGELHYDLAGSSSLNVQSKFKDFDVEIQTISPKRSIIRASKRVS